MFIVPGCTKIHVVIDVIVCDFIYLSTTINTTAFKLMCVLTIESIELCSKNTTILIILELRTKHRTNTPRQNGHMGDNQLPPPIYLLTSLLKVR